MNTIEFNGLPEGSKVHGAIYDDPSAAYRCGHIVDIFLPNGAKVAIVWNGLDNDTPFEVIAKGPRGGSSWTSAHTARKAVEFATYDAIRYGSLT